MTYPKTPGYQDTDTSRAAALSVDARTLRDRCYAALGVPSTADEIARSLGETVLAIRPRITELAKLKRIVDTGVRRKNESGRSAIVWRRL